MTKRNHVKAIFCSKLAIATALVVGATPVAAQGIQGTVDSSTGIGAFSSTGQSTTVTVNGQQAVVNWTATGANANGLTTFQDSTQTLTFQGATDFAVLNRVSANIVGNGIYMNGTVNSLVGDITGGTVYFYSPNGIVIGNNASFNVGSLGLTTLPIADDGQGNWMSGFGTGSPQVVFGQATNAASYIRTDGTIDGGLNASGFGSYVALVAPRVEHRGVIRTDTGAALVGAAGATITFNTNGLYDIQVTTGSTDANGVVVDGGTIERNSQQIGGNHRAYLVAVPANNAMTMLVQGGAQLGFDIAGSAGVEGNAVVLSSGGNVFVGQPVAPPLPPASINVNNATITSDFRASAGATIDIGSSVGATSFSGAVNLIAGTRIDINATTNDLTIGGALDANVDEFGDEAVGGEIRIGGYNGATLSVVGDTTLSANGYGFGATGDGTNGGNGTGGNGTGGSVLVQAANGGTVRLSGGLVARADGAGGGNSFSNGAGGTGTGGLVQVLANDGNASVTVAGFSDLSANGIGGSTSECTTCTISGGAGTGGRIDVNGANGAGNSLSFGGGLRMNANGEGGDGDTGAGNGTGGQAYLSSADGTAVAVANGLEISADGSGGYGFLGAGGSGTGGTAGIGSFGSSGGTITIAGSGVSDISLSAEGYGGGSEGAANGGVGQGGFAYVDAPGATTNITGNLFVSAAGDGGGSDNGTGGNARGGNANVRAQGANLTINGTLRALASGSAGDGIIGGFGQGGGISLNADNGAMLRIAGLTSLEAIAIGGLGGLTIGGLGGDATGGNVSVRAGNGSVLSLDSLLANAGADASSGFAGGNAIGGQVNISTATGGSIGIDNQAFVEADARGGFASDGDGGNGRGGTVTLVAGIGAIDVRDILVLSASGEGGATGGAAATGGLGEGGLVIARAVDGGILTLLNTFRASALGLGGGAFQTGAFGGAGIGGNVDFQAQGTSSTIDARALVTLDASGQGGVAGGDCSNCGGSGGDGTGGQAFMGTSGGLGNRILLGGDIEMLANGIGSSGYGGAGGDGVGGAANIKLNNDGLIVVTGNFTLSATGSGGDQSNGGFGGNGTGGDAAIELQGGALALLTVGGATVLDTGGEGGSTFGASGGTAGNGTGGWSFIFGSAGSADFAGLVTISADGSGGDGAGGGGGDGASGQSWLNSDGADFAVAGNLTLEARSFGGSGMIGGDAIAFVGDNPPVTPSTDARILARNGTITIAGQTVLDVSATGGNGANGGNGGNASAGYATVHARNSDLGPATITLGDLAITAAASGGAGGAGFLGNLNGGAGGSAIGGFIAPTASAGNGRLIIGATVIDGTAIGGAGGAGGFGTDVILGGNGGTGGAATGADLFIGTESAASAALGINDGSAIFASIVAVLDAQGGTGGDGGSAAAGNGVGGTGGAALGGDGHLAARGSLFEAGSVLVSANALGGNGGLDPNSILSGAGGNATAGGLVLTAFNRAGNPAMRGTLDLGATVMTATATGGTGATNGLGYAGGRNYFEVTNSDAAFASFAMINSGSSGGDPAAVLDPFIIDNGSVVVAGDFTVINPTIVSIWTNNATLSAANLTLTAGNFIRDFTNPAPTNVGTISADTMTLTSGQDMIIDGNLVSGSDITIAVPGTIEVGTLTAADEVFLRAGNGPIATGNIDAGLFIDARATGLLTFGTLVAGDYIDLRSNGGIALTSAISGETINFLTTGAVTGGTLTAGNSISGQAVGAITLGALSAGLVDPSLATGAGYSVRLASDAAIVTGTVAALGDIGFGTPLTLTTGNLSSGGGVLALIGGAMNLGAITTPASGYVYLADYSMSALGGTFDAFDRAPILAATPIASGGAITIGGNVTTGNFQAAGASFNALDIAAVGFVEIFAGGAINFTNLFAGDYVDIAGGSILFANIESDEDVDLASGSTVEGGAVTSGDSVTVVAEGNINLGAVSAGIVNPSLAIDAGYSVGLYSNASIVAGTIDAAANIGLAAAGTITTGDLAAGGSVLALGGDDMSFGSIATGALGQLYIADFSMAALGGSLDSFDPLPILAAAPVASAGAITISGNVTTGSLQAAGASFDALDIAASSFVEIFAGDAIDFANLVAGDYVDIAGGSLLFANIESDEDVDLASSSTVSGGAVTSGDSVTVVAQGNISLGAVSAGIVNPSVAPDAGYSVGLASNGSITTGAVTARESIGLASATTLTTGNLVAGGAVLALADGALSLGSITTGGGGEVYLADFSMLALGGDIDSDAFDPSLILAANPVATSGSIGIGGPVSTGLFQAAAGTSLTAGAIDAQAIEASAGGLATIGGQWSAPAVLVRSNNIDITASGSIDAGIQGEVVLQSTNPTQALIGDGLTGTGYALSNAEFGRISSGSLYIQANGNASAAHDMLIGDLAVTGPLAGSTLEDPNGILVFATGDLQTQVPGGVIRVVGDVAATGFQAGNGIEFFSDRFELDAATGSISILGQGGALAGNLEITADRIHVASGTILDLLAANPQYSGYRDDLNDPAAVQRPDGVLRAGTIWVYPTEAVLVQNSGTFPLPAGFVANGAELIGPDGAAPGSIELIVNGQIITPDGTLTGVAVRDALLVDDDPSRFAASSMINGCALVGICVLAQRPPPIEPTPDIATQFVLFNAPSASDLLFGNEEAIEDNEEDGGEDSASSPIQPPAPLFNTKPLAQPGDTDEPVSGGGNPALTGNGPIDDDDDDEEDQ